MRKSAWRTCGAGSPGSLASRTSGAVRDPQGHGPQGRTEVRRTRGKGEAWRGDKSVKKTLRLGNSSMICYILSHSVFCCFVVPFSASPRCRSSFALRGVQHANGSKYVQILCAPLVVWERSIIIVVRRPRFPPSPLPRNPPAPPASTAPSVLHTRARLREQREARSHLCLCAHHVGEVRDHEHVLCVRRMSERADRMGKKSVRGLGKPVLMAPSRLRP